MRFHGADTHQMLRLGEDATADECYSNLGHSFETVTK